MMVIYFYYKNIFMSSRKGKKIDILTAECDKMFSVAEDQVTLFKAKKGNKRNREKADDIVSKLAKIVKEDRF